MPVAISSKGIFRAFKGSLGIYLALNYALLIRELQIFILPYNIQGRFIPDFLPSALMMSSSHAEACVLTTLLIGIFGGILLIFHSQHRWIAILCFLVWNTVLNFHPFVYLPQDGYIGWFLLAMLFVPDVSLENWIMPESVWKLAWFITGLSYFTSAWSKFQSTSWYDGWALSVVFDFGTSRDNLLTVALSSLPEKILMLLTWGTILFEALLLPLSFFERGRKYAWFGMLTFHFLILVTVNISSVSFAFLVLHLFLLRPEWIQQLQRKSHAS